jgi:proteasome lid subunit RPN8/RPN11
MTVFVLPPALRAQLAEEARAAYPRECCGLIEGRGLQVLALHPAGNLSAKPDRFEIDPADHVRIQRAARAAGTGIIGCYHSHPDGEPAPSDRDRDGASERDFVWLIAGAEGRIGAYVFDGVGFQALTLTA